VSVNETYDISAENILEEIRYPLAKCSIQTFRYLISNVSTNVLIQHIFSDNSRISQYIFDLLNRENYDLFHFVINREASIESPIDYRNVAITYISSLNMLKIFCWSSIKLNHILNECHVSQENKQKLQEYCEENFFIDSALMLYDSLKSKDVDEDITD
jgi:hypothetical protein